MRKIEYHVNFMTSEFNGMLWFKHITMVMMLLVFINLLLGLCVNEYKKANIMEEQLHIKVDSDNE